MASTQNSLLQKLIENFGLTAQDIFSAPSGNINETYIVETNDGRFVLQAVNPIFGPEVNEDILAVTEHLTAKGIPVPRLIRANNGEPYAKDAEGKVWRLMTWMPGETIFAVDGVERCKAVAAMLGKVHVAMNDFTYIFKNNRGNVHITETHVAALKKALHDHAKHLAYGEVSDVASEILSHLRALPMAPHLPERVLHGDPKISNFLFSAPSTVSAVIDLDTFHRGSIDNELGDAFRSWCNVSEDASEAKFSVEFYRAGFDQYKHVTAAMVTNQELQAVPLAIERIALELAARFCADALNESYFKWDHKNFSSASEHNIVRAKGQLHLAKSIHSELQASQSF